jgi:hypothetical protein
MPGVPHEKALIMHQWTVDDLLTYTRAGCPFAAGDGGGEPLDTAVQSRVRATQTRQEHR